MRRTLAVLVAAIGMCLGATALAGPPGEGAGSEAGANRVSGLAVEQKEDGTYLRLRSTQTPSFSVFKLKRPLRLVVDVSNSTLGLDDGMRKVDDGVVSRVSLLEGKEEGNSRVRLIVGFEQSTHYDVRTEEDDVVIFVEGNPTDGKTPAARAAGEANQQELEDSREEYEKAKSNLNSARDRLEEARSEIDRLETELEEATDAETRRKLKARIEKKSSRADKLRSELEETRQERDQARAQLAELEEKLSKQRSRAKRQAEKLEELEKARSNWNEKLQTREKKYESAVESLEQTEKRLSSARREIERLREQKDEAEGENRDRLEKQLEEKSAELEEMQKQMVDRRGTVEELKSEVGRLERERTQAKERVAELKQKFEKQLEESRAKYQEASENLESTRQRLEKARQEIETLRAERDEASGKARERLERKLTLKTDELEAMERRLSEQEQTAQKLRAKVEETRGELEARDRKITKLEDRVAELQKRDAAEEKVAELEQKLEQKQSRLEDLRDQKQAAERNAGESSNESQKVAEKPARAVPLDADRNEASGGDSGEGQPNSVEDIRLESDGDKSRIVVELDRPGEYKRLPWKESRAVMLLNNVELPERLEQTLAAGGDSGAVRFVSSYEEEGQVRMEAELDDAGADEKIRQEGDKLVWEFAPDAVEGGSGETKAQANNDAPKRPQKGTSQTAAPPDYPRTVTDPSKVDRVPGMSRKQLTIDLRDADVQNVLRLFSKEGGVNIIAGDGVEGAITLRLRSVPLDEAFLIVLQSLGLGFEARGNVIRVAPQKRLLEEQKKRQKARRRAQKTRPLEVFLMPVNYAEAGEMVDQVNRLLSPRGSVSVDERTNTLIIKDLPENIRSVRELVGALDAQVPQVLIEARIVETNDSFSKEFGIQWGGDFTMSQGTGNPTGLAFPNVLGVGGGATDGQTPTQGTSSNPNFAVNLPAPAGSGSGGAIGMTMGSVNGAVNLNLRLSAAEEAGRTKIISAPKILTLDNREATISQGTSIPISVVSAAGVQTVFVDATLELTVTPHVTPDGNVQMSISATKNEPDFQNTGAQGDPTIIRKQAETELLVEDGETTVIGGIYTRNSGTGMTGIPVLHQIPILGSLFKTKTQSENRTELLIFLTPRVVNRAEALGGMSAGDVVEPGAGPSLESGNGGSGGGGQ